MSEYKFEKEIIGSIHTAEDRYAIDKEDYEGFEKQREELSEVYRKAEAFDAVLKSEKEAISESHMADDVLGIIDKYKSGDSE